MTTIYLLIMHSSICTWFLTTMNHFSGFVLFTGRYPDGSNYWTFLFPTPNAPNALTSLPDVQKALPEAFKLVLFPNPFNQQIMIRYYLPKKDDLSLAIYTVNGQKIWQKTSSPEQAGWHQTIWRGRNFQNRDVASGLYFLQVRSRSFCNQRKLLLIR